ncbi:MAG: glycosyltransferase, partial [Candidatus Nanoarchaeia archaeon]
MAALTKASIVVITYNEEQNITDCLSALTSQDYGNYDILIIDASHDSTSQRAALFPNVNVITSKRKGYGIQRNLGIKLASGDIIAFTDADCMPPQDWLSKGINSLEKHQASALGGNAYPPTDAPLIGRAIACLGYPAGGAVGLDVKKDPLSTCNAFFKKSALTEINGFNETMIYGGEDTDLCKRLKEKGHNIVIDPSVFIYHKTRTFSQFLQWNIRRGRAKYHLEKDLKQLLMPFTIFIYPFTSKYRKLFKKRKELYLNWFTLLILIPALFFLRQLFMTLGWIKEAYHQTQ